MVRDNLSEREITRAIRQAETGSAAGTVAARRRALARPPHGRHHRALIGRCTTRRADPRARCTRARGAGSRGDTLVVVHETQKDRLNRNLDQLLQELRVVLPGVQVLFAFLLAVPVLDALRPGRSVRAGRLLHRAHLRRDLGGAAAGSLDPAPHPLPARSEALPRPHGDDPHDRGDDGARDRDRRSRSSWSRTSCSAAGPPRITGRRGGPRHGDDLVRAADRATSRTPVRRATTPTIRPSSVPYPHAP